MSGRASRPVRGGFDPLGIWGKPVPKPMVMAASGIACTLSIELALASAIVVVAEDVRFCQLESAAGCSHSRAVPSELHCSSAGSRHALPAHSEGVRGGPMRCASAWRRRCPWGNTSTGHGSWRT